MFGGGAHAHNDDLSLCVNWKGRRVFADRGSGLYTPAPELRNALRSVRAHTTFSAGDREPRPIPVARPTDLFSLPGTARAPDPARLARRIEADGSVFRIIDQPPTAGEIVWRFQLDPAWTAVTADGSARLHSEAGELVLSWSDASLAATTEPARHALRYGTVVPATQLVVRRPAAARGSVTWELRPRA